MTYGIIEEFGRIAMSQNLAASLARASGYAQSQLHREVALEHLLLALTEDPDAAQVLTASNIDIGRLNADVSAMIGRIEDRNPPDRADAISVSPDLKRILEAAGAAAAKGRRREINGAIVVAAIVGDGRTTAAHLLRAQGLTFEEAIRVLRASPSAAAPAATTQPVSGAIRPAAMAQHEALPAPQQEPAVPPARSRASTEDILASARERVQRARSEAAVAGVQAGAPQLPMPVEAGVPYPRLPGADMQPPRSAPELGEQYPPRSAYAEPVPAPLPETMPYPEPYYEAPPPTEAEVAHGHPPPLPVAGESALPDFGGGQDGRPGPDAAHPRHWPSDEHWAHEQSHALPHLGWTPPPAPPVPGAQEAAAWNAAEASAAGYSVPGIERAQMLPAGIPGAGPPPSYREPQLPPHPVYPPWPEPAAEPISDYPAYQGAPQAPLQQAPSPAPRPQSRAAERRGGAQLTEPGQLVENIPRVMRKLVPVVVEARIAKADVNELMSDLGNGPTYRHEMLITKSMSVRLRAPEGGFFIETTSPETQWIENTLGLMSADFASWRWTVTPRSTGKRRLQLVVAARTVGADGLAAETALPERVIDVAVKTNYALAAKVWGGWVAAAIVGGALSKFGQSLLDASTKLATLLKAG